MNWELVLQICTLALVGTVVAAVVWALVDASLKNRHERNLELRRVEHDAEQTLAALSSDSPRDGA